MVSRRTRVACWIFRRDHPSRPKAVICCFFSSFKTFAMCFQEVSQTEKTLGLEGLRYRHLAADPSDPNFTVIAQPVFPASPLYTVPSGATQAEANAINALNAELLNQEQQFGCAQAAMTAVNRAQGASDAGDAFWQEQQTQAAITFNARFAAAVGAEPALLTNAEQALVGSGFPKYRWGAGQPWTPTPGVRPMTSVGC
jgi:hypothetical protein